RNAWQTTGNILGLRAFHRQTRNNVTSINVSTRLERKDRFHRKQEASFATLRQLCDLAALVLDDHCRLEVCTTWGRTPIDDNALRDTSRLVRSFRNREAVDEIFELDVAFHFRKDWTGVRIPLGNT